MTTRDRVVLVTTAATLALSLLGPGVADANSRRHIFKPDANGADGITRDVAPAPEAPEIDGTALSLGLVLVAGGVAALLGRRRAARS
jgi:hypothetical protein